MELHVLREFFMWCTLINMGFLVCTAMMCVLCRPFIIRVHGKMFGLTEATINTMLYGYLAFYKIVFIVFCLIPYLALTIIN